MLIVAELQERIEILPYAFCPHCGCRKYTGSGNMTAHPEHWEEFNCLRYHAVVGYIDNSPFVHALECPPEYDPTF